jgi:DNA-binding response OmpR family regulator
VPVSDSGTARRVVLVEDDEKFAVIVARALARIGFVTSIATTGDAALTAMRRSPSVAAAILDVMIPHPDGIEVCRQLRRDGFQGPIIVISALDSAPTRFSARQAGADVFLTKPFGLTELLEAVTALIEGRALGSPQHPS